MTDALMAKQKARVIHLDVPQVRRLDHWCLNLSRMFTPHRTVSLVGSVLTRPHWRDIDVRVPLEDDEYDALPIVPLDLNYLLSTWGRQQTHLPIDCQVQPLRDYVSFQAEYPSNERCWGAAPGSPLPEKKQP